MLGSQFTRRSNCFPAVLVHTGEKNYLTDPKNEFTINLNLLIILDNIDFDTYSCLEPTKNQAPKYLRLPNVIFNDINLMMPIGTGKLSSTKGIWVDHENY